MSSDALHDGFTPVAADELTDEKLVAGQLRALQREVRDGFELVTNKLLTNLERLNDRIDDVMSRLSSLERYRVELDARLDSIEARLPRKRTQRQ